MSRALAAAAAAALALAGCGDDEEKLPGVGGGSETAATTAGEEPSRDATPTTEAAPGRTDGAPERGGASPEEQPGGAGDEVPARTQALLTGRRGRIAPRKVRVPPFISVRLELRSADGRSYAVRVAGRRLSVRGGAGSSAASLPGLRPGRAYVGRGSDGARLRIEASAEPGP